MSWIRVHPYISALCATVLLILSGIYLVQRHSAAPISNTTTAWGGENLGILDPISYSQTQNTGAQGRPTTVVQDTVPYIYIPPAIFSDANTGAGKNSFDFNDFISTVTVKTSVQSNSTITTSAIDDAYSFIPSGFFSTTSQAHPSLAQESIYQYGNTVGSYIRSYEQQYPDSAAILKDQFEDRANPEKALAVEELAGALESVGQDMLDTSGNVPQGFASAHAKLAQSYIEIGKNLALIPKATSDAEFLAAIETYNASADTFVKNYIALATLLSIYEVTFSSIDAGSVFTFSPASF